jgi:hypothetical protein
MLNERTARDFAIAMSSAIHIATAKMSTALHMRNLQLGMRTGWRAMDDSGDCGCRLGVIVPHVRIEMWSTSFVDVGVAAGGVTTRIGSDA